MSSLPSASETEGPQAVLNSLLMQAPSPILVVDESARIMEANAAAAQLLQCEDIELIGRSAFKLIAPDEAAMAMRGFLELPTGRQTVPMRTTVITDKGAQVPIELRVQKCDDTDRTRWLIWVRPARDLRAFEQSVVATMRNQPLRVALQQACVWFDSFFSVTAEASSMILYEWAGTAFRSVVSASGIDDLCPTASMEGADHQKLPWNIAMSMALPHPPVSVDVLPDALRTKAREHGFATIHVYPINVVAKAKAALVIWHRIKGPLMVGGELLIERFERMAGLAINHHDHHRMLTESATIDPPTNSMNRTGFLRAVRAHTQSDHDVAVMLIKVKDLDAALVAGGFRCRDDSIRQTVQRVRNRTDSDAVIARVDDDVIGVLLVGATKRSIESLSQQLLDFLGSELPIVNAPLLYPTIGVATGRNIDGDELFRHAERTLATTLLLGAGQYAISPFPTSES